MTPGQEAISYLDRRLTDSSLGVTAVYDGVHTTWTLPYSVATDGSEGTLVVALQGSLQILTVTRPAANQVQATGDYHAQTVIIGVLYTFLFVPSPIYFRDTKGNPDTTAKLVIRRLTVQAEESTDLSVVVRRLQGTTTRYAKSQTRPAPMEFGFAVGARNDQVRIEISSSSPGALALENLTWRGEYFPRARKV